MKDKRIVFLALMLPILLACFHSGSSPGIGGPGSTFIETADPVVGRLTLLAVDYSKSTEGIRSQLLTAAFDIGTGFDPASDTMRVYRFGHSIEEVYSGLPKDDDAFATVLTKYMKESDPVPGTDYPHLFEQLAKTAKGANEQDIRIIIVGDGGNDFAHNIKFEQAYRDAAGHLAQDQRIKLVRFWGVEVGMREEIRSVFKPLGERLQIESTDQNPLAP